LATFEDAQREIGPRKPAARPWLALGISRSTSRAKARQGAAWAAREAVLDRLAWQLAELRANPRQDGCGERRDGGGVELSAVVYLDVECGRLATSAKSKVRYREQPGKHMLVASFTHFDPKRSSGKSCGSQKWIL
jgi:hypothetical protein